MNTISSITELKLSSLGQLEATSVKLEFSGAKHSGPMGDIEFSLAVKTVRHTPPGGRRPIEQVISSEWQPFSISGHFSDGRAGRAGFAMDMYRELSGLASRHSTVRVRIGSSMSWIGIITELAITYRTDDKIGWRITLSPHQNESAPDPITTLLRRAVPVINHVRGVAERMLEMRSSSDAVRGVPSSTDDILDLDEQLDDLDKAVARTSAIHDAMEAGEFTERSLLQMSSAFRSVRSTAIETAMSIASKTAVASIAYDDVIGTMHFEEWIRTTRYDAMRMAGGAYEAEVDTAALAQRKPAAIHIARAGETLERIASSYYGSGASWRLIYDANPHIVSTNMEGGERLVIPAKVSA